MKKLLFSSAFILGFYCVHAQDTLRYDYALLDIDASFWGHICYDDGHGGMTRDTVPARRGSYLQMAKFHCFHYLNDKGYDMVLQNGSEYVFRRRHR